jgi:hypothetical protein
MQHTEKMAAEWPAGLYERARQRLLENEPLLDVSDGKPAALSSGEAAALESVGLSTAPFKGSVSEDPLQQSIADYMALLDTSHTTSQAAKYLKLDASRIRQDDRDVQDH